MNNYVAVASITVTFNPDITLLKRQIQTLVNQINFVIIVDNASKNIDEIDIMLSDFKANSHVEIIKCEQNVGLGAAQNKGIKLAKALNASHVLLLDQDSVLPEHFVEEMKIAEAELDTLNETYGAIGPVYFNEKTGEVYPITKYIGPFIKRLHPQVEPVEATFLIASGCFIKMEVLDIVGGMNEELFIDYVDVEWCFRAKNLGYKMFANPNIKMMHTIGDSRVSVFGRKISVHSPLRRYYLYRNSIYMIRNKSIDAGYKLREITFNILRLAVFLCLSDEKTKYLKYSMRGLYDGMRGKIGICPHKF